MSLMDPKFKYVRSGETDIRKTFRRVERELKEAQAIKAEPKVRPIRQPKKGTGT